MAEATAAAPLNVRPVCRRRYVEVALRFAQRLERLRPGGVEATEVASDMTRVLAERRSALPAAAAIE